MRHHVPRYLAAVGVLVLAATAHGQSGSESSVGYIDSAIPKNTVRLRYDSGFDDNRPERAEFFYPQKFDPVTGPAKTETKVDFRELTAYLEWAPAERLSGFLEVPERFLEPEVNPDRAGLGDINFGAKLALLAEDEGFLTFQFRTYVPTGAGRLGLGTNHVSLEPALLFNYHLSEQVLLEGEFRDWIPVGGTDFAGNTIRYGVGLSYPVEVGSGVKVAPVVEFVGWTVLNGKDEVAPSGTDLSAAGDTIVNAKVGARTTLGDFGQIYVGYGRALTGTVWYKDMLRLEYRLTF
jgi:hypothetical protein